TVSKILRTLFSIRRLRLHRLGERRPQSGPETQASSLPHNRIIGLPDALITFTDAAMMDWDTQRIVRHLKLRDLNVLLTVVRCGSMGKAAAQLSVSQPAISKAIAEMEHALGTRLLDRTPHGVEPTIYARALL